MKPNNNEHSSSEKVAKKTEPTSLREEEIEEGDFRRSFTIPKRIKRSKLLIEFAKLATGALMMVVSIWFFISKPSGTTWSWIFAILLIFAGTFLVILFPFDLAKVINSNLILGEQEIRIRNNFRWKEVPWKELQEILITEKLSSDPSTNISIGIGLIRFRTVTKGVFFIADLYPVEETNAIKFSLKQAFEIALEGSNYTVKERLERPSIRTRLIYLRRT